MFSKRGKILMGLIGLVISLLAFFPSGAHAQEQEKVAYELVKTAAENAPSFKEYFAGGKAANLETFVANASNLKSMREYYEKNSC